MYALSRRGIAYATMSRAGFVAIAMVALLSMSGQALASGTPTRDKPNVKQPPMADQTIPGSPVSAVARDTGSVGILYGSAAQFYGTFAEGIFLWVNGQVWGPASVPSGPPVNEYTTVSNTLIGSGTEQNPWRTITVLRVGDTGLQLTRSVRYVNGSQWTRQDFELRNTSGRFYTINLFHAADLSTAGGDSGFGYYDVATHGIGGYDETHTFYQLFIPITAGSRYKEALWQDIWAAIGNTSGPGPGFDNSYHPDENIDNGAGLQWTFGINPQQRISIADFHSFSNMPTCAVAYTDIFPSDYYFDPIMYLSCAGAISGYADGSFRPVYNTTRSQLCKIVVLAENWTINTSGGPHFSDVPPGNPFYSFVETAYNHGIIAGYGDGTFRWGNDVTRGQLCKIIVTAEGWSLDTSGGPHFTDVPTSNPFYPFIETAYHHGIISGYGDLTFRPNNSATRGQISKIVYSAVTAP